MLVCASIAMEFECRRMVIKVEQKVTGSRLEIAKRGIPLAQQGQIFGFHRTNSSALYSLGAIPILNW